MEYDVPEWICPKNMKLALSDIKVSSYFSFKFLFNIFVLTLCCLNTYLICIGMKVEITELLFFRLKNLKSKVEKI